MDPSLAGFPSTCWTVLADAGADADPESRRRALEWFAERYWPPVYAFLRRSLGRDDQTAMDLAQAFFVHVLEKDLLGRADRDRGRLRSFLRVSLRHFVRDQERVDEALRRGGPSRVSLSAVGVEPVDVLAGTREPTLDEIFDDEWRSTIVRNATESTRAHLEGQGRGVAFEAFRLYELSRDESVRYADVAERLGIGVSEVQSHLRTAREVFRNRVRAEVRETIGDEADLGSELAELFGTTA